MSDILRITDPIPKDDSIDEHEYSETEAITGTNRISVTAIYL